MKSLKNILEGLLSGQEQTIEFGNNLQDRSDLIASWKKIISILMYLSKSTL